MNSFLIGINWLGEYSHGVEEIPPGGTRDFTARSVPQIPVLRRRFRSPDQTNQPLQTKPTSLRTFAHVHLLQATLAHTVTPR